MSAARIVFWASFGSLVTVVVLERLLRLGSPPSGTFIERAQALARKAGAGEPLTSAERRAWNLRRMLSPVAVAQPFLPNRWMLLVSLAGLGLLGAYVLTVARLPSTSAAASSPSS